MQNAIKFRSLCYLLAFSLVSSLATPTFSQPQVSQPRATLETPLSTGLQVASVFSDHMVLQRDREIPIWGTAKPGESVSVDLNGKLRDTTADDAGRWKITVGPLSVGDPFEMRVWTDGAVVTFRDILVGEVWIASGQSNMEWPMAQSNDSDNAIAAADWPKIRILDAPRRVSALPQDNLVTGGWRVCSPETIKKFSAVAYFFGHDLHEQLDVPIGLISSNYGGTPMEAWTSQEALATRPTFAGAAKVAKQAGNIDSTLPSGHPTGLFNGMIHPLIPYGIRGVIWYQGEANAGRHKDYRELSELMITDWRQRWGQGEFPFLLVQLAAYTPKVTSSWPYLREAQLQTTQTVPNVGMAVATDIGDKADIHPRNKQDVGKRLALAARALAYDEDITYSGPIYKAMEVRDGQVHLEFNHVGAGLQIGRGKLLAQGPPKLRGFEIAGEDQKFVEAKAELAGDLVVVSSDQVPKPVAVRYNWTGWTVGNLYNASGLPASPFRTDRY